jgi:predicted N-acetyltransferase YhbS
MELESLRKAGLQYGAIHGPMAAEKLDALLTRCFQVPPGSSFLDDFPVWDERYGLDARRLGAFDGDRLVASACGRMATLRTAEGELPVALIGAVAVDAAWRGRGLASALVSGVADWARLERRAAMTLLWSGEHELYARLGFVPFGRQARVPLAAIDKRSISDAPVHSGWVPGIFGCLRGRSGGLALKASDRDWIAAHKNVSWWWTGPAERPTAYAAVGRGIDLGGIVHEWGGDRRSLLRIFATLDARVPGLELLASPAMLKEYVVRTESLNVEALCLAVVHDAERVRKAGDSIWLWGLDGA